MPGARCFRTARGFLRRFVFETRAKLCLVANATRHLGLSRLVVPAAERRIEVDFGLVHAVFSNDRVGDPPDVAGAPHIG